MNKLGLELTDASLQIGKKTLIDQLSLRCEFGEVWGIIGANGCGKTSLLHAIARLGQLTRGNIRYHGLPDSFTGKVFAQHLGILLQENHSAFATTVRDYCANNRFPHLRYFQKFSAKDEAILQQALEVVELSEQQHQPLSSLSGGERRRVAIAGLLVQSPQIYLLDEPSNHLDLYFQTKLMQQFYRLAKDKSRLIVLSVHDLQLAETYCDKILLFLSDGKLLAGEKHVILTEENLSKAFKHPIPYPLRRKHNGYQNPY